MQCAKCAIAILASAVCATTYLTASTVSPAGTDRKQVAIASLVQPVDNPWVVHNVRFQKLVAKALGIELTVVSDKGTEDSNIAALQGLIARRPDGILFDPITQAAGRANAKALEEARVPGVTEDRLVVPNIRDYKGKFLIAQVTQNNEQWGYDMMMALLDKGAKNIVAIMDPRGVTTVEEAWKGARRATAAHPGVKVLKESWQPKSRENAMATMERYLARFAPGEVDGCWCIGSTVGLGALQAIKRAGRQKEIKVSTADDDDSVIAAIKDGGLSSTLGGHWMNGGFGLIVLYDYLNGHAPLVRQPQFNLIAINKTNADAYAKRFLHGEPFSAAEIRAMSLTYNPKANIAETMKTIEATWNQ
jgi:ABC-type sugar transport system substrate-binding protein